MKKKKRRKNPPEGRRRGKQHTSVEPEHWEAYLNDPIALMQDGEYHLLDAWQARNDELLYGEDPVALKRRQAAFWDYDRNDPGVVRYPDDYKVEDEEPDAFDGDDDLEQGYRADYVVKSWGAKDDYECYTEWDDEDWPF